MREAFSAFNRGDYEAVVAVMHPDVEWVPYLGALQSSIYRGRRALVELWTDVNESFGGGFRIEPLELVDCGEKIVAVVEAHGTGSSSGAELEQRWAQVATLREGLIIRVEPFPTRESALEAARPAP